MQSYDVGELNSAVKFAAATQQRGATRPEANHGDAATASTGAPPMSRHLMGVNKWLRMRSAPRLTAARPRPARGGQSRCVPGVHAVVVKWRALPLDCAADRPGSRAYPRNRARRRGRWQRRGVAAPRRLVAGVRRRHRPITHSLLLLFIDKCYTRDLHAHADERFVRRCRVRACSNVRNISGRPRADCHRPARRWRGGPGRGHDPRPLRGPGLHRVWRLARPGRAHGCLPIPRSRCAADACASPAASGPSGQPLPVSRPHSSGARRRVYCPPACCFWMGRKSLNSGGSSSSE